MQLVCLGLSCAKCLLTIKFGYGAFVRVNWVKDSTCKWALCFHTEFQGDIKKKIIVVAEIEICLSLIFNFVLTSASYYFNAGLQETT